MTESCFVSLAHYSLHSPRHGSRLAHWGTGKSERQGASYIPGAAELNPQPHMHRQVVAHGTMQRYPSRYSFNIFLQLSGLLGANLVI